MRSNRKPWWALLALAAVAGGCSNEPTETDTPHPSSASAPGPSTVESTIPGPASSASKDGMKGETASKDDTKGETKPADAAARSTPEAKGDSSEIKIEAPTPEPATKGDKTKSAAADAKLTDEEVAEIKKLPADEQTVALKQMVCPVSDEHLGAMGKPLKVTAEGKTFYLCCKGCTEEVEKNPKSVVAKLTGK